MLRKFSLNQFRMIEWHYSSFQFFTSSNIVPPLVILTLEINGFMQSNYSNDEFDYMLSEISMYDQFDCLKVPADHKSREKS